MALTPEQQSQIEFQQAMEQSRRQFDLMLENRRSKLEAVRLAKETLIENRRNQPVDAREVTASDITNYANTLITYINE